MSIKSIVLAAALAIVSTSAFAVEDFAIPQTATVPAYEFPGRKIDIIGFTPGMGADEALELFRERKPDVDVSRTQIGSRNVSSVAFPSRYSSWERENEEINVLLTSPSAGNQVYFVSRKLDFWNDEKKPDFEATLKAFTEKYGEPSAVDEVLPDPQYVNRTSRSTTLMWYLGGEAKCDLERFDSMASKVSEVCTKPIHQSGYSIKDITYSPGRAELYAQTAEAGSDVVLVANVYNHDGSSRASRIMVSFVDLKRRAISAAEDIKLIEAEQAKFDNIKNDAPEL